MNSKNFSANGSQKPRAWIFQANPNRYRIEDSLRFEKEEFWNLNQHSKEIHAGDHVLIWISGHEAGVYAIGTVVTEPTSMSDSPEGLNYWNKKRDELRVKPRVRVRYDLLLQDTPLLKVYLQCNPELWDLKILSFARGTNFPISEDEWQAITAWIDDVRKECGIGQELN